MKKFNFHSFCLVLLSVFALSACVQQRPPEPGETGAAAATTAENPIAARGPGINGEGYQGALKIKIARVSLSKETAVNGSVTTIVSLTGENFVAGAVVTVNGVACSLVSVASDSTLICSVNAEVAPELSGAPLVVVVSAPGRETGDYTAPPTAPLAPTLTSNSPSLGPTLGGTTITLTGANFVNGATVKIGSKDCVGVLFVSDTRLTCQTPGVPSAVMAKVTVTNPDAQSAAIVAGFDYQSIPPTISSVVPDNGIISGGTPIIVSGTDFQPDAKIFIGAIECAVTSRIGTTSMGCATPAGVAAGLITVKVTHTDNQFGQLPNGFNYNAIPAPTWSATDMGGAPTIRRWHTAFWTGQVMVVWGGSYSGWVAQGGGLYDPISNSWIATNIVNQPTRRFYHSSVWTGSEMIVWGGMNPHGGGLLQTGGKFDPILNSWEPTGSLGALPSARQSHTAAFVNGSMIVFGGQDINSAPLGDCASYNPANGTWTAINASGAPSARSLHTAIAAGTKMIVWGGEIPGAPASTGGIYDAIAGNWTAMNTNLAPSPRYGHTAIWTGFKMIVFGGLAGVAVNDGAIFDPSTNMWSTMSTASALSGRAGHTAVWTGTNMLVFGGRSTSSGGTFYSDGGSYDFAGNTWSLLPIDNAPVTRADHSAVWTGDRMIVWGGAMNATTEVNNGRILQ